MNTLRFTLPAIAPFRLDLTIWALRRRSKNRLDQWDGEIYTRVFVLHNRAVKVEIRQKESGIFVMAKSLAPLSNLKSELTKILNQMLGLQIDLKWFYAATKMDRDLQPLESRFRGVKPPRFPTIFETLTNAICNQQLSLESGLSLLNRFIEAFGKSFKEKKKVNYAFPTPSRIKKCTRKELMALGFSKHKTDTLLLLSRNETLFRDLEPLSNEEIVDLLCRFKGIGRWSAEYTLLRGLGRIQIIPGDDVGIHESLKHLLKLRKKPDYSRIKKIEKKWYPYAGLIYFHLLLNKLAQKGLISRIK